MFQYAAGRRLAFVKEVPLKLHIVPGEKVATPRPYNLHAFNILEEWATPDEVEQLKGKHVATGPFARLVSRVSSPARHVSAFVAERHFQFDPQIGTSPEMSILKATGRARSTSGIAGT